MDDDSFRSAQDDSLELILLGKPELRYGSRPLTADLISAKGQALLIYLAVTGHAHSRAALAGLLWGDMPEETARANLRLTLTRLRKAVPHYLDANRLEVAFDFNPPHRLDVGELTQLLKAPGSLQAYRQAAVLYRGEFLHDFILPNAPDFELWVATQREGWHQSIVTAMLKWMDAAAQVNELDEAIEAARRLLQIEPWHEQGHRRLMRLLLATGQRSAALAQYDVCRQVLAEELGVDPSPETVVLYEQIKRDEVAPAARRSWSPAAKRASVTAPSPHNLLVSLTSFVGRKAELARLVEKLRQPDYRLVTIVGEGGAGKTRLALMTAMELLADFPDGAWFVPLAGLETAAASPDPLSLENNIANAIAAALGVTFATPEELKTQITNTLRSRTCLLILDNFEPLLAGAGLVLELLTAAPQVKVMVTSREPLHFQAEYLLRLEGLAQPPAGEGAAGYDSVRLFAERAERSSGRPVVDEANLPDVAQICRFVNGLPLGIELAAAGTRWYTPAQILEALQTQLAVLETSLADVTPRHRSMQAVFDHSWRLLSSAEQQALAQFSIFRRGFQLEAAQAITGTAPTTVFALLDKSLLQDLGEGYYGLHALLRQFAAARLAEMALDQPALRGRHAAYYLARAGEQAAALYGREPQAALHRLQADAANLAQAWQWAATRPSPADLAAGVRGMAAYWAYAGLFAEGEQALLTAITHVQPLLDTSRPGAGLRCLVAGLHVERAGLLFELSRLGEMEQASQQAITWGEMAGDEGIVAQGRLYLGQLSWRRGQYEAAEDQLQQAQALARSEMQPLLAATIWRSRAALAWRLGNLALAADYCHRSWQMHQKAGDTRGENRTRHFLAILAINQHDYTTAQAHLEAILSSAREIGERRVELSAYAELAQVAGHQGQFEQALVYFERERQLAEAMGVPWQIGTNLSNTGDLKLRLGDFAGARACYNQALSLFRQIGGAQVESNLLAFMGLLAYMEGAYEDGRAACEEALRLAQQTDSRREQAFARLFLAHNLAALERWQEALVAYELAGQAWRLLGDRSRLVEAQAGEAQGQWALGNTTGALATVAAILTYLEDHNLDGADDPVRVYLRCYKLLRAAGDAQAPDVLQAGRRFLEERAARIRDPVLRQSLLHNIPSHRALRRRWSEDENLSH